MKLIKNIIAYLIFWVSKPFMCQKNKKQNTKIVEINGKQFELLPFKDIWIFPEVTTYSSGLGSPIAMLLYVYENGGLEYYTDVTKNIPQYRNAGCQFIDANNNREEILDWLEQNKFGKRTGNKVESGYCIYPEFNFYLGDNFWKYKNFYDSLNTQPDIRKNSLVPISHCTISELADKLLAMEPETMMKVAGEGDGSEIWGVECIEKFGHCILHFGYEGGPDHEMHNFECYDTQEESKKDLIEKLLYHFDKEDENGIVHLFMEEPVYSGLYMLVSNEYCDDEDIDKVLNGDKETYTNLLIAEKIELYILSEFIEAFNYGKINSEAHTISTMSADIREILRLE